MPVFRRIESRLAPSGQVSGGPRATVLDITPITKAVNEYAAVQEQRDADQELFEFRREADQWERSAVFDPETGAINRKGRDAFDVPKALAEGFDKFSLERLDRIANPRARMAAQKLAQARREQITGWADRYALGEREKFHDQQYQADILSMQENAALYVNDPARLRTEMAAQADRTFAYLKGKGASEEVIAATMKENAGKTHALVIGTLLTSGDTQGASEYLKAHAGNMKAADVLRLRAGMMEAQTREVAQKFGDEADANGWTMQDALEKARAKFSGPEETAAVQEIKTRFAEKQAIEIQSQRQAADSAWKVITNGGNRRGISPELWNTLGGEEQRQINDYLEAKWRRAKADAEGTFKTDMVAYYGLRRMAAEAPGEFAQLDLMRSAPKLSESDLKNLINIQGGISKSDAKEMETQRVVQSTISKIEAEIRAAGINLKAKPGSEEANETAAFMGAITMALDEATRVKGSPLTGQDARLIGMNMLREGVEQGSGIGGWFQNKRRGYQMEPGKTFISKPFNDIPPEDQRGLIDALAKRKVLQRSIYGSREYVLTPKDRAEIERAYQRGVEAGMFNP